MRGTVTMYMVPYSVGSIGGISLTPLKAATSSRHRIAVSDHENPPTAVLAQHATRQAPGSSWAATMAINPSRSRERLRGRSAAQRRRDVDGVNAVA